MVSRKVDGLILFDARSEKPKNLFGTRSDKRKIYLVPNDSYEKMFLAVKGLVALIYMVLLIALIDIVLLMVLIYMVLLIALIYMVLIIALIL